jgi:hypothetical protein
MNQNRYLFALLCSLCLGWSTLVQAQSLSVSFAGDSIFACAGEPYVLRPEVSGGQAPYQYNWNTGHSEDSLIIFPLNVATYQVVVQDLSGQSDSAMVVVVPLPECVYPGDGNGDRVADMRDLLSVGYSFSAQGPIRPNAHLQWIGQAAPAWGQVFNTGVDYVHTDADGNGVVGSSDFAVIEHNYSGPQDTGLSVVSHQGLALSIRLPNGTYGPGDTVRAEIWLDQPATTLDSIYGISFSVRFDQFLVQPNSIAVDYGNSDLGQIGLDLHGADEVFYQEEQIDLGLTRLDQVGRRAFGRIADIVITIEDLEGKRAGIEMLSFALENITLLDPSGQVQAVVPLSAEIPVEFGGNTTGLPSPETEGINIFPQPAQAQVQVTWPSHWPQTELSLYDQQGRRLRRQACDNPGCTLDLQHLTPGVYLLHLQAPQGLITRKLWVGM